MKKRYDEVGKRCEQRMLEITNRASIRAELRIRQLYHDREEVTGTSRAPTELSLTRRGDPRLNTLTCHKKGRSSAPLLRNDRFGRARNKRFVGKFGLALAISPS
jgi:hypothetical protein